MAAGLDVLERFAPALIELHNADSLGFTRILWALLALFPGRVDAANVIRPGVSLRRQFDRLFILPNAKIVFFHVQRPNVIACEEPNGPPAKSEAVPASPPDTLDFSY